MPRAAAPKTSATPSATDSETIASGDSESLSLTQASRALSTFSTDEVNKRANDLVQYLLVADQKKAPIKRQDINKHVLKEMSRGFLPIMEQAKQKLLEVFGIRLVELDGAKQQSYVLVNKFDIDSDEEHLVWPPEDNAKLALAMIILSVIFMNGNAAPEAVIWNTLKKLGLDVDNPDTVFKDLRKLVTQDFVKQGYLCYERVPNSDPVTYDFTWGARAKTETSKMNVLEFVSQIYDNMDITKWSQQYADAR